MQPPKQINSKVLPDLPPRGQKNIVDSQSTPRICRAPIPLPFDTGNKTPLIYRSINLEFPNELWPSTLGFMNLKTLLDVRLVSKLFQTLASKALSEKAVVKFYFNSITTEKTKFAFAKTSKTEINIAVHLQKLNQIISDIEDESISMDKLKLKVRIENYEIGHLLSAFSNSSYKYIQALNLTSATINGERISQLFSADSPRRGEVGLFLDETYNYEEQTWESFQAFLEDYYCS